MLSASFLTAALLFTWRFFKVLAPVIMRGHGGAVIEALSAGDLASPQRTYLDGLARTTLVALVVIGMPLTISDQSFVAAHSHDAETLLNVLQEHLPPTLAALGWTS